MVFIIVLFIILIGNVVDGHGLRAISSLLGIIWLALYTISCRLGYRAIVFARYEEIEKSIKLAKIGWGFMILDTVVTLISSLKGDEDEDSSKDHRIIFTMIIGLLMVFVIYYTF